MILRIRVGGALPLLLAGAVSFGATADVSGQTVPDGWRNQDIGSPIADGGARLTSSGMLVLGAGDDIAGRRDQFHYVYWRVTGDVDVRVRVDSIENIDVRAKAGLMIRNALTADSRHALVSVTPSSGIGFRRRLGDGQDSPITIVGGTPVVWLRLVRKSSQFSAYRSSDGRSWALIGSASISMGSTVYVGLAATSGNTSRAAAARFSNLAFGPQLPSPWTNRDIGSARPAGSATASSGTFTVRGGGADIWGGSDQFHYVYQPVSGDVEIIARLNSFNAPYPWAMAGVMIRGSLAADASHAFMLGSYSRGWSFNRRLVADAGTTYRTAGPSTSAPGWIRLVREGSLITGYHSTDGTSWRVVDSDTIALGQTAYVGLAVTSHDTSALATAVFSNVVVRSPTGSNEAPQVAITSPSSGSQFAAGQTITMQAAAKDLDGTIARVDLFTGATRLKSDSTSPYSVAWTPPAGQYSLSAVAYDNDGQRTTSGIVTITVGSSSASDSECSLVFTASSNHTTDVSSYSVSIYRSADSLSASPVAAKNIGKPTPVNGDISVDISALVSALPSGLYKAVVTAIGPGGTARSEPSPDFGM
jgi:regulation of enolase protein 1 (concanavalin A-like superfamily)